MAISFLGRETCRPKNPGCNECVLKKVCEFYNAEKK
jgi:endonuclease III